MLVESAGEPPELARTWTQGHRVMFQWASMAAMTDIYDFDVLGRTADAAGKEGADQLWRPRVAK